MERIKEAQAGPKAMPLDDSEVATQDLLSKFLAKNSSNPDAFTSFHIISGCLSNMVAGSDTTAISLSAILYYLVKYPRCMIKLREEVDSFTAKGELSYHITYKQSLQMPYLQAIIKEALRLYPATGLPLERVVPKGGATISGCIFPEGSVVGINIWVAHRDIEVFGHDADEFSPERWLQDDVDRVALMNRFWMPKLTFPLNSLVLVLGRASVVTSLCLRCLVQKGLAYGKLLVCQTY
ncbi:hypothetical protein FANTH_14008 [Fusarium anthophilum]|uniref:Cytochrome P450 monooxygenase n=1 Tax=Fusarium anthophilum TaxID=48485 RepID=A0A8H4YL38_9HYPO|nr:hypothetical protein FANTH_14008 [Fusarium anthophilum]